MCSLLYEQSRNGRSLLVSSQEELNAIHTGLLARTNERLGETETAEELKLTAQETLVMRTYYHSKIRDICQALDFSMAVAADAHIFLHRYFIRFGPLEHDLKHTMLACIYLATKCQNMHLSMDEFVRCIPNTQAEAIVDLELVVLEAVDFRPPTFSPVPCLFGFLMDYLPVVGGSSRGLGDIHERSQRALDHLQVALMIEDVVLLHPPAVIALACVLEHLEESETYWETRLKQVEHVTDLYKAVEAVKKRIAEFQDVSTEQVKLIDKKIKLARQAIQ